MKKRMDKFGFWDIGFLKLYGAIFGAIVGAYFPEIIKAAVVPLAIIFVLLASRYLYLLFIKQ
ncbi:MAG: hypothetical protein HKN09_02880 [Saprospiraceae bacterium]|nr:hypothetical protein [Saprospiraceae bacterium]